ncbi:hypothetical protein, partial [Stenotrophomonas sp. GbtcB23]|uniref:hypothetical protein n=1 Tax=Stenotrophomonas sp. GbtcB23 TaxID=2824768 RepID=UPI001C2FCB6A
LVGRLGETRMARGHLVGFDCVEWRQPPGHSFPPFEKFSQQLSEKLYATFTKTYHLGIKSQGMLSS